MEKFEEILNQLNTPLISNEDSIYLNHKIFQKYTSQPYYKYAFNLLETLCNKTNYENKNDEITKMKVTKKSKQNLRKSQNGCIMFLERRYAAWNTSRGSSIRKLTSEARPSTPSAS